MIKDLSFKLANDLADAFNTCVNNYTNSLRTVMGYLSKIMGKLRRNTVGKGRNVWVELNLVKSSIREFADKFK